MYCIVFVDELISYFRIQICVLVCYISVHTQEQPEVSSSSQARQKLEGLLNKNMRIRMTDGRTLVGLFLCTDRDCNVILGSAQEFLKSTGVWKTTEMTKHNNEEIDELFSACESLDTTFIYSWFSKKI